MELLALSGVFYQRVGWTQASTRPADPTQSRCVQDTWREGGSSILTLLNWESEQYLLVASVRPLRVTVSLHTNENNASLHVPWVNLWVKAAKHVGKHLKPVKSPANLLVTS